MGSEPHWFALECQPCGVARGVVLPETVVQDRARVGRKAGQPAHITCSRLPRDGLDQPRCLLFLAPPGREHHLGIGNRRIPGRLRYQMIFFDQPRCRGQLAGENMGPGQVVERKRQVRERTPFARELDLADRQGMPGLEVPQLHGDDLADPPAGEPQPVARFAGADVQRENHLERPVKGGGGRRVSLRQPQCDRVQQDINRTRRAGTKRCGARSPGRFAHDGTADVVNPHRGPKGFQVRCA